MTAAAGNKNSFTRLIAVVLTGILAGLSGMVLALILHAIQHLAFGYSPGQIVSAESFLQGVTDSSWPRRISAIVAGGAIAGFGWWLLGRYGQKRVSIAAAVANPSVPMPAGTTTIHALLQIVTVALGSPLGREVAPREMGALGAGMVARKLGLTADETRTLVACGAGAGLAAVYNVPLAGALFSLEVMLLSFSWEKTLAAIITSAIAAWTATLGLGDESQYHFASDILPHSFLWWAVIAGPILGAGAWLFRKATSTARSHVRSNWQMPVFCLLAFSLLAVLSLYFPELPGNGKGPMQLALNDELGFPGAAMLLALKMVVIPADTWAGGRRHDQPAAVHALATAASRGRLRQFCSRRRGGIPRCIHANAANGGGAGDGVHPHGSQLSGSHAAVRRRGVFNLPDTG